jgi:hypothetical protein
MPRHSWISGMKSTTDHCKFKNSIWRVGSCVNLSAYQYGLVSREDRTISAVWEQVVIIHSLEACWDLQYLLQLVDYILWTVCIAKTACAYVSYNSYCYRRKQSVVKITGGLDVSSAPSTILLRDWLTTDGGWIANPIYSAIIQIGTTIDKLSSHRLALPVMIFSAPLSNGFHQSMFLCIGLTSSQAGDHLTPTSYSSNCCHKTCDLY